MLLSAVSVLVVAQSISELPEVLMNNPVYVSQAFKHFGDSNKLSAPSQNFREDKSVKYLLPFTSGGSVLQLPASHPETKGR